MQASAETGRPSNLPVVAAAGTRQEYLCRLLGRGVRKRGRALRSATLPMRAGLTMAALP
jgi:hypothetical protein